MPQQPTCPSLSREHVTPPPSRTAIRLLRIRVAGSAKVHPDRSYAHWVVQPAVPPVPPRSVHPSPPRSAPSHSSGLSLCPSPQMITCSTHKSSVQSRPSRQVPSVRHCSPRCPRGSAGLGSSQEAAAKIRNSDAKSLKFLMKSPRPGGLAQPELLCSGVHANNINI